MNTQSNHQKSFRAVGYRRVSMRDQIDGHSLDAQEDNIRRYVREQGWQLLDIYIDAGISAKKGSHRPAFEQLMQDAGHGKFDVVVVDKIDRFYRHLSGLLASLDMLNNYGVSFASVQEKLDFTSPWGKLMLTVLGMLAEIYIDNLRQETRKGKIQRARKGLWLGGIPFGYCNGRCSNCNDQNGKDYCPNYGGPDQGDGKVIIPHPIESQVVRQVFDWYVTGDWNHRTIALELNTKNILLPDGSRVQARQKGRGHHHESPRPFSCDVIRDMLKRLAYTGKLPYQGVDEEGRHEKRRPPKQVIEGAHQPIVDEETFNQAQEIRVLKSPAALVNNHRRHIFPLTGLLYCVHCGRRMRGVSRAYDSTRYYRCSSTIEATGQCPQTSILATPIERQVLDWLWQILEFNSQTPEILVYNQKDEYEARYKRANQLYLAGAISLEEHERETIAWNELKTLLQNSEIHNRIELQEQTVSQLKRWEQLSQLNKKRSLRLALEAIYVHGNALVGLTPTVAFLPLVEQVPCLCGEGGIRTRGGV